MTGRAGVREADDIVKFLYSPSGFFSSYFINDFWHYKKYGSVGRQGRIQGGGAPGAPPPPKIGKKYDFFGVKL